MSVKMKNFMWKEIELFAPSFYTKHIYFKIPFFIAAKFVLRQWKDFCVDFCVA